jgi:hypothetical protein
LLLNIWELIMGSISGQPSSIHRAWRLVTGLTERRRRREQERKAKWIWEAQHAPTVAEQQRPRR